MNIFELLTFVIILIAGGQTGVILASRWGIWGWIIGIPTGLVVAGAALFFQFRLIQAMSSHFHRPPKDNFVHCSCGKDYLKVGDHYLDVTENWSIVSIMGILIFLGGIPLFGNQVFGFLTSFWGIWSLIVGLPWGFFLLLFLYSSGTRFRLEYRKRRSKPEDYRYVQHTDQGDLFTCTCGKECGIIHEVSNPNDHNDGTKIKGS